MASEAKQHEVVQELYNGITRGRNELKLLIKGEAEEELFMIEGTNNAATDGSTKFTAKGQTSPLKSTKDIVSLYQEQILMLDEWEEKLRATWMDAKKAEPIRRGDFLCSKTKELEIMCKNFKARKLEDEREADAAAEDEVVADESARQRSL